MSYGTLRSFCQSRYYLRGRCSRAASILSTPPLPFKMSSANLDSPRHKKFEWEDGDPRPVSAADASFASATYGSTDTLHDNVEQLPASSIYKHSNQMLTPQIAELGLTPQLSRLSQHEATRIATNVSTWTTDPGFEVDWEDGDPDNPRNWPLWYKSMVIFAISYGTLVV